MSEEDETLSTIPFLNSLWEEKPIKHYTQVIPVTIHHFYITGEISDEVDRYIDMLNIIKTAEPHDKIFIYLNTPGGDLNTTIQIISAITKSPAEITTVLEGEVCSAGTFIFLSGDYYIVNDNCSFMIHNYSHGMFGKGGEVVKRVKFSEKYFNDLAHSFYTDFLTEQEIQEVCEDKDFWMGSKELIERLKRRGDNKIIEFGYELEVVEEEEEPKPIPKLKKRKTKKKPPLEP